LEGLGEAILYFFLFYKKFTSLMRSFLKLLSLCLVAFFAATPLWAQVPEAVKTEPSEPAAVDTTVHPLDGIVKKNLINERPVLTYDQVREADIFWEKRIWRIIDVREKMNLTFSYPEEPFFQIIMDAATKGDIRAYNTQDDKFLHPLEAKEVASMGASVDTIRTFDPETYEEKVRIVINAIDPSKVQQYRVKEVWFFDKESSTLQVRILGIAPLFDEYDDNGNFKFTRPLFWIYYPDCRSLLARHKVFNAGGNDAAPNTWEDLFEMRYFASYVYKESNIYDRRLQEYLSGVDLLLEGEKIKQDIFNFEHDLWSY
jgi:gliding motility associated protien GldN